MFRKTIASAFALGLLLLSASAFAAGRSEWTAGNGVGYTWTAACSNTELESLANGSTFLCATAVTNQTAQDQYMDLSGLFTVASATPPAGASIQMFVVPLQADGTTYGDGTMTLGGTAIARQYQVQADCFMPLESAAAATVLAGLCRTIVIPPGTFAIAVYNGSGAALNASTTTSLVKYRTYNVQNNN